MTKARKNPAELDAAVETIKATVGAAATLSGDELRAQLDARRRGNAKSLLCYQKRQDLVRSVWCRMATAANRAGRG